MVLVSKKNHLVVHVELVLPAFTIPICAVTLLYERLWQRLVCGVISFTFIAASVGLQRIVRRVGDELEIWTVLGRRRLKAKRVFLGVKTSGRGFVDVALFLGKSMHPAEPSILVASQVAPPLAVARRIAEALDMPEFQVDPGLYQCNRSPGGQ